MKRAALFATALVSLFIWATGCTEQKNEAQHEHHHESADAKTMAGAGVAMAHCDIMPTKGNNAKGTVHFTQTGGSVKVVAEITGLTPNAKHGFHIHEGSECGDDGMKAGGHYNPEKHEHGMPNADVSKRHAGDMGNLQADKDGNAHYEATFDNISINGPKNPIVNHCIIVHAKPDDGSQPTGNAGARIGCGVIKEMK